MAFQEGDRVQWTTHGFGLTRTKTGVVVVYVPANSHLREELLAPLRQTHHMGEIHAFRLPRNAESYLVSVPNPGRWGQPTLYWPRTKGLRKIEQEA